MPQRPLALRLWWTFRDYAKRVWDNSGEDNILFLAGGIAFNILLAFVPFVLLLVSGLGYLLNQSADASSAEVVQLVERLLPQNPSAGGTVVREILSDVVEASGAVGLYSAVGFIWFSTRLFGSLRSVLCDVFDIEQDRGIVAGKIFDIRLTIIATLLVVAYTVLSAYLAIATTRGIAVLRMTGLRENVMGQLEYVFGRIAAFAVVTLMFFALYKVLPNRRIRVKTALVAALFTSTLFEIARNVFTSYVQRFDPGSLYTGTLAAIVILVFWVYYAALIFILGGEVGQVYELRRVRRLQREALEDY
jgi:membrane protein